MTVKMVRDPVTNPQPHSADVHPDEIGNFRAANFVLLEEANFEIEGLQPELELEAPKEELEPIEPAANPFAAPPTV